MTMLSLLHPLPQRAALAAVRVAIPAICCTCAHAWKNFEQAPRSYSSDRHGKAIACCATACGYMGSSPAPTIRAFSAVFMTRRQPPAIRSPFLHSPSAGHGMSKARIRRAAPVSRAHFLGKAWIEADIPNLGANFSRTPSGAQAAPSNPSAAKTCAVGTLGGIGGLGQAKHLKQHAAVDSRHSASQANHMKRCWLLARW